MEELAVSGFININTLLPFLLGVATLIFGIYKYIDSRKIKLKVSMKNGFLTYTNGELSDAMLILRVSNKGQNPVIINTPEINLRDNREKGSLIIQFGHVVKLPYRLEGGEALEAWCEIRPLAEALKRHGLQGRVELEGSFVSQVGDQYCASKACELDIDDWTK